MRIAVVTALWHRRALAGVVLRHMARMREELRPEGIELDLVAVASNDEDAVLGVASGWQVARAENDPLARKWTRGIERARVLTPDAVVIIGSDDLIHADVIRYYARNLDVGPVPLILGLADTYVYRPADDRMAHWPGYDPDGPRAGESCGSGRCLSRALLDALDWQPWDLALNSGLDASMRRRCTALGTVASVVVSMEAAGPLLDVKDDEDGVGIGSWHSMQDGAIPCDAAEVLALFPVETVADLAVACDPVARMPLLFPPCDAPQLAAAIIVRDMVDTFPATLRSLAGRVDEVCVVVDAASHPRTAEIARKAGCRVVVQPWKGYGSQRTDSLALCRAPWCLVIDADEAVVPLVSENDVRPALAAAADDVDGFRVRMQFGAYDSGQRLTSQAIRVIRRSRASYVFAEHNELRGVTKTELLELTIRTSYAHRTPEEIDAKIGRMLEMAAEEPLEQHHLYHLAHAFRGRGRYLAASQWAARCIALDETTLYAGAAYYELALAAALYDDGRTEAERLRSMDLVLERATELHPHHADMWALWSSACLIRAAQAATTSGPFSCLAMVFGVQEAMQARAAADMLRFPVRVEMRKPEAAEPVPTDEEMEHNGEGAEDACGGEDCDGCDHCDDPPRSG